MENLPLFVYGTLTDSDVVQILIGRVPTTDEGILDNYRRYGLRNRAFPGLVPEAGASTRGLLITGLDQREHFIFDEYEDDDYERILVQV